MDVKKGSETLDSLAQYTWDRIAQRTLAGGLDALNGDEPPRTPEWRSTGMEVKRSDSEIVRVLRWTRGEDLVITLQWLEYGEDRKWRPLNSPPPPGLFE